MTIWNIAISPFGKVRFRDFFFADVITRIGQTLVDISGTFYFTIHFFDKSNEIPPSGATKPYPIYAIIVGFLPFWWRLMQCLNKYYYTRVLPHTYNAGKYTSKLIPPFIALFYANCKKVDGTGFFLYLVFQTFATVYCLVWDYYMDWGLFRSKNYLRKNMSYGPRFYYFAMVANFLLRFYWVIGLFHYNEPDFMVTYEFLAFFSMLAEAIRRAIWSLIRIENEFHNNFEAYRSIPMIPTVVESVG